MPSSTGHTAVIRAKKVLGTTVKDPAGQKIGHIEDVVLDKLSNTIVFAVVSFGGFLGIGEKYHPIPWASLDYRNDEEAYVVKYTRAQLEAAPSDTIDELIANDARKYRDSTTAYYGPVKTVKAPAARKPVKKTVAVAKPVAKIAIKPAAKVAVKPAKPAVKAKAPAAKVAKTKTAATAR